MIVFQRCTFCLRRVLVEERKRRFLSSRKINYNLPSLGAPLIRRDLLIVDVFRKSVFFERNKGFIHSEARGQGPGATQNPLKDEKTGEEKKKDKVANYVVSRYIRFLDRYSQILEKNFPVAIKVYKMFVVGFKEFTKDVGEYVKVKKKVMLTNEGVGGLTRKELELYYQMPKDMWKVGPVLIVSALPMTQYLVFPIAYHFPKHLLSHHFWTIQQRSEFAIEMQKERQSYYKPVFRQLQSNVHLATNPRLMELFQSILDKLGSGSHPGRREIMEVKRLFEGTEPFSIKAIYAPHAKGLCRMHGIHARWFKRNRLFNHAQMLIEMDEVLRRDGLSSLKTDELRFACYIRGLNASNTSTEDMKKYLVEWTGISSSILPHSYSLLLHLPIFLGYNDPNNWALK